MATPLASEPAEAYDQIFRLERNLLAASKSKGPFDLAVRRLRTSIRDGYEALILRDLTFCEGFEVEQALWRLHYREIEGFRLRIRKLLTAIDHADEGNEAVTERRKKRKKESKKEPLQRALTSFKSFLGEASGFFHGLLVKLRLHHGLTSSLGNTERLPAEGDVTEELRRCMVTCHRILIYLGDLARYKELYAVMDASVRDWSVAANYYKQAAVLWPSSGNPYNQLAVLCTYCANSLTALYLYCRSLAVSVPFGTAWDNVVLLFGKNKQYLAQALALGSDNDKKIRWEMTMPSNLHGFVIEQDLWSIHKVARSQGWFIMRFIELVRILLIQPSADELDKALNAAERKLEQFLWDAINVVKPTKLAGSLPLSLQVTTILIFCMHHITGQPSLNRDYILSSSLRIALRFCSSLAKVGEQGTWSAFPVTVILMEWLTSQPKALHIICAEKAVGLIFSEFCERVAALDLSIFNKNMDDDLDQLLQRDNISRAAHKAQWEDHELLGFVPLASTHLKLDFSSPLPGYGVCDLATYSCWKLRYLDALQKLWNAIGSGCPDQRNINLGTEESNPTPSLKEWIEKTFFSADVLSDLAHSKQVEVQCEEDAHVHEEVISTVHGRENANPCDVQTSPKPNVESVLCEASTKIVAQSGEDSEHSRGIGNPTLLTEPLVLSARAMLKFNENSLTNAYLHKVENVLKKESCDSGCSAKTPEFLASGFPNQSLIITEISNKLPDMDKETKSSFSTTARDVLGNRMGTIHSLHNQQAIPSVLCFDSITHVKPRGFIEALSTSKLRKSFNSSIKNNLAPLRFNGQSNWDKNAYETQNPFVLRLRKMS